MVVSDKIHNIMGGIESSGDVRLHNHRRKLKQRFDLVKKLGQGTYGKVQLGINKETGQEVAIKTIRKCKIETEADLIRIRREIQIMSSVRHPNIIHIYEVFENREKMVLVMEYAAGGELYDYLSEKKVLPEEEARRIFRQIATAIYYCHKHNICHRDLKLENILLDEVGNAKIADFGLSNVFSYNRLLSTFCGSPLYASPEIVKGTPYHGPEVDCWSLGVLLYTLVYGAMPFDGSNFKRLVRQISQGDYFEPKNTSPASPLIAEMLTVNPARRADVEAICNHWWINETYSEMCLDVAEELASQTPVRLDLLLSLTPTVNSEQIVVDNDKVAGMEDVNGTCSRPLRSQSMSSIPPQIAVQNSTTFSIPIPEAKETAPEDRKPKTKKKDRSHSRSRKDRSRSRSRRSSEDKGKNKSMEQNEEIKKSSTRTIKPDTKTTEQIPTIDSKKVSETEKVVEKKKPSPEVPKIPNSVPQKEPSPKKLEKTYSKVLKTTEVFNGAAEEQTATPKKLVPAKLNINEHKQAPTTSGSPPLVPLSPLKKSAPEQPTVQNSGSESPLDFPLASTVALNKLVECALRDEPYESVVKKMAEENDAKRPPFENQRSHDESKVKNAVKVIGNAIEESSKKASTLPRRRTSHAEIQLKQPQFVPENYKTEVEHYINKPAVNHKTEVVFPVSAPLPPRPLTKQDNHSKEHIIPIQVENESTVPKLPGTSLSQSRCNIPRTSSSSLSRQSTVDSDSGSNISAGEPIRRSANEVIIPIAVEGGGYVTPSHETLTRMSSLTESEDEASGNKGSRCFTLRSTKRRQPSANQLSHADTADSLSSDEDDNFQLLTAENLFSTLLSRVRSLTHRLNNEELKRSSAFPRSLFSRDFFDTPPSRRLTETKSFSRPESAPWRRNFTQQNDPPRRDKQNKFSTSMEDLTTNYHNVNSGHSDIVSSYKDNSDSPNFFRARSLSKSGENGSNNRHVSQTNLNNHLSTITDCTIPNRTDNQTTSKSHAVSQSENTKDPNTASPEEKKTRHSIDEEFDAFFAKYKKPNSMLYTKKDYFAGLESRIDSRLPPRRSSATLQRQKDSNLSGSGKNIQRAISLEKGIDNSILNVDDKVNNDISSSRLSQHRESSPLPRSKSNTIFENTRLEAKPPKRVSRFLRPDFYDTPREESKYVKDDKYKIRDRSISRQRSYVTDDISRVLSTSSISDASSESTSSSSVFRRMQSLDGTDINKHYTKYGERNLSTMQEPSITKSYLDKNNTNISALTRYRERCRERNKNNYRKSLSDLELSYGNERRIKNGIIDIVGRNCTNKCYDSSELKIPNISVSSDVKEQLQKQVIDENRNIVSKTPDIVKKYSKVETDVESPSLREKKNSFFRRLSSLDAQKQNANESLESTVSHNLKLPSLANGVSPSCEKNSVFQKEDIKAVEKITSSQLHSTENKAQKCESTATIKIKKRSNTTDLNLQNRKSVMCDTISKECGDTVTVKIRRNSINKDSNSSMTGTSGQPKCDDSAVVRLSRRSVSQNVNSVPDITDKIGKSETSRCLTNDCGLNKNVSSNNIDIADKTPKNSDTSTLRVRQLSVNRDHSSAISSHLHIRNLDSYPYTRSISDTKDNIHGISTLGIRQRSASSDRSPAISNHLRTKTLDSNPYTKSVSDTTNTTHDISILRSRQHSVSRDRSPSLSDVNPEQESVIDRIRRRSFYTRFNIPRLRSSNDITQRRLPSYSRSLSADCRQRSSSLTRQL